MCLYAFFYLLAAFSSEDCLVTGAIEVGFPRKARHERDSRCQGFSNPSTIAGSDPHIISSPAHPELYPNGIDCVRIINAQNKNEVVVLDFIGNIFHIEADGRGKFCTYDFLEVRDGPYGFSPLIGIFCGEAVPGQLIAPSGSMWLRFKTDHGLSFAGFQAQYHFEPMTLKQHEVLTNRNIFHCKISFENVDGILGTDQLHTHFKTNLLNHTGDIDCVWAINVHASYFQIRLFFPGWALAYPNHCDENFMEVYYGTTASSQRVKTLCGKTANKVEVRFPKIYIRLFLKAKAVSKTFINATYGAFVTDKNCSTTYKNMFQCKDGTCIPKEMQCNGRINCVYQDDEKGCKFTSKPSFTFSKGPYLIVFIVIVLLIVMIIMGAIVLNLSRLNHLTSHYVQQGRASFRRLVHRDGPHIEKIVNESPEANHEPVHRRGRCLSSMCMGRSSLRVHSSSSDYTFVPGPYDMRCPQASAENVHAALSQKGYRLPYNVRNPVSEEEEARPPPSQTTPDLIINGLQKSLHHRKTGSKRVSFTNSEGSEVHDIFFPQVSPSSPGAPSPPTFPSDESSLHRLSLEGLDTMVQSSEADEDTHSEQTTTGVYVFSV